MSNDNTTIRHRVIDSERVESYEKSQVACLRRSVPYRQNQIAPADDNRRIDSSCSSVTRIVTLQ